MFLVALWLLIIDWQFQRFEQPFFAERHKLRLACCPVCGLAVGELIVSWVHRKCMLTCHSLPFYFELFKFLWLCMEIGMKNLPLFLPSCHNWCWDMDRYHSRTDTSMWFTLDLHRWERSYAPRGRCQLKSFFIGSRRLSGFQLQLVQCKSPTSTCTSVYVSTSVVTRGEK